MKLKLEHKVIPKESTLVLGISGGRDSMALVHALLAQRPDLRLVAAHVNHNLRKNSKEEAAFVDGMMQRWNVTFEGVSVKPPKTGNLEEWGRDKRYEFFEKIKKKHKADFILTAHHQNDDFETMMLHFLRGTRVKGLAGMKFQRGHIVRPLLFTSRDEINAYVEEMQIPYREDASNQNNKLSRNFLRNKIIPVLKHVFPHVIQNWQSQKNYWTELQEILETSAKIFLKEYVSKKEGLDRKAYASLPFPLRATALELWYKESTGTRVSEAQTLERWDDAILNFPTRKKTEWHGKKFLVMTKDRAKIA